MVIRGFFVIAPGDSFAIPEPDWAKIDELMQERKAPLREIKEAKAIRQVIERGLKTRDNPKPPPKLNDFLKIKPKPKDKERGRDDDLTR